MSKENTEIIEYDASRKPIIITLELAGAELGAEIFIQGGRWIFKEARGGHAIMIPIS